MTRNGEPRTHADGRGAVARDTARSDVSAPADVPRRGRVKRLTVDGLVPAENLLGLLAGIANVLRSDGVNDERTRYRETVKLLLARYCDERDAAASRSKVVSLQEYAGGDPGLVPRVAGVYAKAALRYRAAEALFSPPGPELEERTLRRIVRLIQGANLTSASHETMQQVFLSFAPALFKRSLDQFFTPITLSQAMASMAGVGPGDKVADPAMGTADLLTAALAEGQGKGAAPSVFGVDIDRQAHDLAVVNLILNQHGDGTLREGDSIAEPALWAGEMDVVLCNPPFGARSLERRAPVLAGYDLGHRWVQSAESGAWQRTDEVRADQQLGILFIERSWKMLAENGRLAIILPEGYLCTPAYGYVRQWIVDHMQILSLIELPRRVFVKSDADLRSNILVARKVSAASLARLKAANAPIHADLVRKVGFKMGTRGSVPTLLRDPLTGAEVLDEAGRPVRDSDFQRVQDGFRAFQTQSRGAEWPGARVRDVLTHASLDMKPRRLMPKALANLRRIQSQGGFPLGDIADVVVATIDILAEGGAPVPRRLVEGLNIRAVEGTVLPQPAAPSWQIAERKSRLVYRLNHRDIVIGLVRPERRNIGLLLDGGTDVVGSVDGIAVVRVRPQEAQRYPREWLFAALRSEACRLQLWTESGGTSYGKLNADHIRRLLLPKPTRREVTEVTRAVSAWAASVEESARLWQKVGSDVDRVPIVNSSPLGLAAGPTDEDAFP